MELLIVETKGECHELRKVIFPRTEVLNRYPAEF